MPKVVYNVTKGLFQNSSSAARISIPASGSDAPAVTYSVDGSGSVAGTDVCGIATVAVQATSGNIVITFATAYDTAPSAHVSFFGLANCKVASVTTTAITIAVSGATTTGAIHYSCFAQS